MIVLDKVNSTEKTGFIYLGWIIVILFIIILVVLIDFSKNKKVMNTSPYLSKIKEINNKYDFQFIDNKIESKTFYLHSKRQYDCFNCNKMMFDVIKSNFEHFNNIIKKIKFNIDAFELYKKEVSETYVTNDKELAKANKMSLKSYNRREISLGEKLVKKPIVNYLLRIRWEYTSPAGRNHYSNLRDYSFKEIDGYFQKLTNAQQWYRQNLPDNLNNCDSQFSDDHYISGEIKEVE